MASNLIAMASNLNETMPLEKAGRKEPVHFHVQISPSGTWRRLQMFQKNIPCKQGGSILYQLSPQQKLCEIVGGR